MLPRRAPRPTQRTRASPQRHLPARPIDELEEVPFVNLGLCGPHVVRLKSERANDPGRDAGPPSSSTSRTTASSGDSPSAIDTAGTCTPVIPIENRHARRRATLDIEPELHGVATARNACTPHRARPVSGLRSLTAHGRLSCLSAGHPAPVPSHPKPRPGGPGSRAPRGGSGRSQEASRPGSCREADQGSRG